MSVMSGASGSSSSFDLVASAPIFVISGQGSIRLPGGGSGKIDQVSFQELGGIQSEINSEQYIYVDSAGTVHHTKQMGLTKPPTVTLKRGVDNDLTLWGWHNMALNGDPKARMNVALDVYGGGVTSVKAPNAKPMFSFTLTEAWCPKINFSNAKAGEGFLTVDITIACNQILYGDGGNS